MLSPLKISLRIILSLLYLLGSHFLVLGQSVQYTSSEEVIANPERGLQKYSITAIDYPTTVGANNLPVATLEAWKNSTDKVSVVFRYFLLEAFLEAPINATYLDNMQTDFDNIRTAGLKVIVRFSYSDTQGTEEQQPTKAQILAHITQLSPILTANKDVIFSHQAGFIGTWGEWYYTNSSEFGSAGSISEVQWNNRKDILDAMLAATPLEIPLQVRYPDIKTRFYGADELTPSTAYQANASARIGFFNDAFLNNWGDQGTYGTGECENPVGNSRYNYLSNETQYLPMTGETNGLNPCDNGQRTSAANALHELELTNWTTLNRDYHPDFWAGINQNDYNEILRNLGYRFVLNSSSVVANGSSFDLTISLSNLGFARVFRQRPVYLILENIATGTSSSYLLNTDIRTWDGATTITQNLNPGLVGAFSLYLWLPDPAPSLSNRADYCIRFANANTWQAARGYNDLQQTVLLDPTVPVELISLNATPLDTVVLIDWQTASERSNERFIIERSADAQRWGPIGSLQGAGDSDQTRTYQFFDPRPMPGIQFYRLKQLDYSGEYSLSKIVSVNFRAQVAASIDLYPNPASRQINIALSGQDISHTIRYWIVAPNGQVVHTSMLSPQDKASIDISQLPAGHYTLYCQLNDKSMSASFIKE